MNQKDLGSSPSGPSKHLTPLLNQLENTMIKGTKILIGKQAAQYQARIDLFRSYLH